LNPGIGRQKASASPRAVGKIYLGGLSMKFVTRLGEKIRKLAKGQTMTEYALILAAVAIVVFVTYQLMGQDIGSLVNKIDNALTTAS
jgi:Flp pilus assembly pilin Flp